jgi:hypothetical protein
MFDFASDVMSLEALSEKALTACPHRLAIEIREADRLVFSLDRNGATWPGGRNRHRS